MIKLLFIVIACHFTTIPRLRIVYPGVHTFQYQSHRMVQWRIYERKLPFVWIIFWVYIIPAHAVSSSKHSLGPHMIDITFGIPFSFQALSCGSRQVEWLLNLK